MKSSMVKLKAKIIKKIRSMTKKHHLYERNFEEVHKDENNAILEND